MRRTAASRNTGNPQRASSNPYELLQVRHTLTEAQAQRTRLRIQYYENLARQGQLDEQQQSSSTVTGPTDIEAENPDFTQLEWTAGGYCPRTRPYQTFPWCTYHKICWHLVTSDITGLIWTRTIQNGQQEWLTGSILENGDWQFNQTREVSEIYNDISPE